MRMCRTRVAREEARASALAYGRVGVAAVAVIVSASEAVAHGGIETGTRVAWWSAWEVEPVTVAGLVFAAAMYAAGLRSLRAATGARRKLRGASWCFSAGWMALAVALVSPVHSASRTWFSVHMVQHELLMVVAAPLIVLGRPAVVMLWAIPRRAASAAVRVIRSLGIARVWQWATNVFVASLVHAVALWVWHAPVLFEATLRSEWVHAVQHAAFFGSALLFWQAVFWGERRAAGYGLAVVYLFFTAVHSGALGALITFAASVWYPSYASVAAGDGRSALEDQQLGGLIMWIPAGMIYVVAALALFAAWLREPERRRQAARNGNGGARCVPAS